LFAGADIFEQPGSFESDTDVVAQRDHQSEIGLAHPHPVGALDVEDGGHPVAVAERHAHLGLDPFDRAEKRGLVSHIRQQHRVAAPGDPRHHAFVQGYPGQHPVVADLMLEQEVLLDDTIEADLGIAEGVGDGLDGRPEQVRDGDVAGNRRPYPVKSDISRAWRSAIANSSRAWRSLARRASSTVLRSGTSIVAPRSRVGRPRSSWTTPRPRPSSQRTEPSGSTTRKSTE
jgi:hypothetical protein